MAWVKPGFFLEEHRKLREVAHAALMQRPHAVGCLMELRRAACVARALPLAEADVVEHHDGRQARELFGVPIIENMCVLC